MTPDVIKRAVSDLTHSINRMLKELRQHKADNPELKSAFYVGDAGSILNAYREGDLTFDEAIAELRKPPEKSGLTTAEKVKLDTAMAAQADVDAERAFLDAAAIAAMAAWIRSTQRLQDMDIEFISMRSYDIADAMVAERRRRDGGATE